MRPRIAAHTMCIINVFVITSTILAFIFLLFLHNHVQGSDCTMALQLLDPYVRANYEAVIESGKTHGEGGICGAIFLPAPGDNGSNTVFDPISMECINCHDGTVARAVDFRFAKTESQGVTSLVTITASHPIGVDFTKFSCINTYNHWRDLPPEIVLMDGKIGCASCHNLLGTNKLYLSVDMEGSNLCFTCHRR